MTRRLRVGVLVGLLALLSAAAPRPADPSAPVLVVQGGHWAPAHSVAWSPDGTLLASAGSDDTAALWDADTGRLLASLEGHSSYVYAVAFSPDGRWVATGSNDGTVRLWDAETGRSLRVMEGRGRAVRSVAFSPDGRLLASGGDDGSARLWDPATGTLRRELPQGGDVAALAFSPDGRTLAAGGGGQEIRLWNLEPEGPPRILRADTGSLQDLAFHPTRPLLATASWDGDVRLWDLESGRVARTLEGHMHPGGAPGKVAAVAFSPDGSTLAAGAEDGSVHLWDPLRGERLKVLRGHGIAALCLAFRPDGKRLASGGHDPPLLLWDPAEDLPLRSFQSPARSVNAVWFGRDVLLTAGGFGEADLWDLETGALREALPPEGAAMAAAARSPDGRITLTGSYDFRARVYPEDGPPVVLEGHERPVVAVALSPDGRRAATASWDGTARLWSVPDGKPLLVLRSHEDDLTSVGFSPDGRTVATGSEDGTVRLWEAETGRLLRSVALGVVPRPPVAPGLEVPPEVTAVTALAWTPRGGLLVGMLDGQVHALDLSAEGRTRSSHLHTRQVTSLAVSPDGRRAASTSWDGSTILWSLPDLEPLHRLEGHTWRVESASFHPDGRVLATGSDDGTVRLWAVQDGRPLATLVPMEAGREWLAVSPEGFFDGSAAGMQRVLWRLSARIRDTAEPEQFFQEFFHPGLVSDVVREASPAPEILRRRGDPRADGAISRKDRRLPVVRLEAPGRCSEPAVPVRIRFSAPSGAVRDVRLFRDGTLVARWPGLRAEKVLEARVPITAGPNKLTAYAFNSDDVKSKDAAATVLGDEALRKPPRAWVLTVGINFYADPRLDLSYAAPDARLTAAALGRTLPFPADRIRTRSLFDDQATRDGILSAVADLAREAGPEDTVLVALSGHGMSRQGHFYFLPQDVPAQPDPEHPLAWAVGDTDLEEAFLPLQARHILLVLDACQSGQALEADDWRRGPVNARGLGQVAWEKGLDVLAASQSHQAALEAWQVDGRPVGHGLLTWALMEEGLQQAPRRGGVLRARDWLDFAVARVPRLLEVNRPLLRGQSADAASVQTPRVFHRREGGGDWIVAEGPGGS